MKIDDSGMPDEVIWNSLFDIGGIVDWLAISQNTAIVEIGCGYCTFTVPAAQMTSGKVTAYDIDASVISIAQNNVRNANHWGMQLIKE